MYNYHAFVQHSGQTATKTFTVEFQQSEETAMPKIQVKDVNFYYELHGNGPSLILVSGYTSDHTVWESCIDLLKDHFQVLVFDNQGVGQTEDHNKKLSAEEMADNTMELAASLGLQNPYIAGVSMGGTIAQRIATRHGNKINKVALLVTVAKWRRAMLLGLRTPLTMREKGLDFEDIFHSVLSWVYGEEFLLNKQKIANLKQKILDNPYLQSLENQQRQFNVLSEFDGRKDLSQIKAPTMVLYTTEDVIALPYEAQFLAKHIPDSTLIECPGGHGIALERPEVVADHFKQFFLG